MYCLTCDKRLKERGPACQYCKRAFDPKQPATFHRTHPLLRPRTWLLQAIFVAASVVGLYYIAVKWETMAAWVFLVIPIWMGFMLAMLTPPSVTVTLVVVPGVVFLAYVGIYEGGMAGVACLAMLAPLYLAGALAGGFIGAAFRRTRLSRLHMMLLATLGMGAYGAVDIATPAPLETIAIRTEAVIDAPPDVVWQELHFYEEIDAEPPWLLTVGFPRPVRAEGSRAAVGDVETCVYEDGYLKKRITERAEARRLAFEIIEQKVHFEHDVELKDGAFDLAPAGDGRTRLTLTTRYRPLCYPAWLWRDAEARVVRTLHEFVIDGVRAELPRSIARGKR